MATTFSPILEALSEDGEDDSVRIRISEEGISVNALAKLSTGFGRVGHG